MGLMKKKGGDTVDGILASLKETIKKLRALSVAKVKEVDEADKAVTHYSKKSYDAIHEMARALNVADNLDSLINPKVDAQTPLVNVEVNTEGAT